MKKVLFTVLGILVVAVGAVLVVPSFIDWNDYKDQITREARAATGRDIIIGGDLKVTVLPTPALSVNDVRLANVKGASAKEMVRLKSLEVSIAFGPLLGGSIQVQSVRLVDPVIEAEILADGSVNWELAKDEQTPAAQESKSSSSTGAVSQAVPPAPGAGDAPPTGIEQAISFDNVIIENGTLNYRDSRSGEVETVSGINARLAAASLAGPFESKGRLTARGIPLSYDVSVGEIIHGRTVPVSLSMEVGSGEANGANNAKVRVAGTLTGLATQPKFKGSFQGEGERLSGLIQDIGAAGDLPGFLAQAFEVKGEVSGSATGGNIRNLSLRLGDVNATGVVSVDLAGTPNASASLQVPNINADKWLAMPVIGGRVKKDGRKAQIPVTTPANRTLLGAAEGDAVKKGKKKGTNKKAKTEAALTTGGFVLPDNMNGSVTLVVDAITLKGGLLRKFQASAELAGAEVTLSQFSAQLPGGSDVALFGFLTADKGEPKFEGEMETSIGDLRGVLKWLGASIPPVPNDRLRKLTMATQVVATPSKIKATKLDVQFDASRITGTVSVSPGSKPITVAADVMLDRINLDAYMTASPKPAVPKKTSSVLPPSPGAASGFLVKSAQAQTPKATGSPVSPVENPLAALSALSGINADVKARVKKVVFQGASIADVRFDGVLSGDAIRVRNLSVAKLAGAQAKISGAVVNLATLPKIKDLKLDLKTPDAARLTRLAGVELPIDPRKLGVVTVKGSASGSIFKPDFDVTVGAAGGLAKVKGSAILLPLINGFDVQAMASHKDTARLLRALDVAYRPGGKVGGLDITARIKGDALKMALSDIRGKVGGVILNGKAGVDLSAKRPRFTADLTAGEVALDPFLPAVSKARASASRKRQRKSARTASGTSSLAYPPSATGGGTRTGSRTGQYATRSTGGERWPGEPFDLSALRGMDAEIKLRAAAVKQGLYRVDNVDVGVNLTNGVLRAERLSGQLFGGAFSGQGVVAATTRPTYEAVLALKGLDVGRAVKAVTGKALANGKMGLDLNLASTGNSIAEIVSSLNGGGKFNLNRIDVKTSAAGSALAGALDLVAGLNQLGGTLTGGKRSGGLADVSGSFTMNHGVAQSNDLRLESGMGSGQARGAVDIYRWTIDVEGQVALAQNLLTQLLVAKAKINTAVPFKVSGRLDAPDVKLDTSKMPGGGIQLPGASALRKKLDKKGLGGLVDGILGGALGGSPQQQPQQQPPSSDTPPPPPSQQQQQPQPQDLIRGLLKGLGR